MNDGDLFLQNSTQVIAGFGHMKGFGMRSDGNAYMWNDGNHLVLNAPNQNIDFSWVYGIVTQFAVGADGNAYFVNQIATLFRNTPGSFDLISNSVQSFSLTGASTVSVKLLPASLPAATAGQNYTIQVAPTAVVGQTTFALAPGSIMPSGLKFSPAGVVSGTSPTAAGSYSFVVQATNPTAGFVGTQTVTLRVVAASPASVVVSAPPPVSSGGTKFTFSVTVRDKYGNPCPGVVSLTGTTASGGGAVSLPGSVTLDGSGTATVTATANHSGSVRISAGIGGSSGSTTVTINATLFYFNVFETVEYYDPYQNVHIEQWKNSYLAATYLVAYSMSDYEFKQVLNSEGRDWFGLPTFQVLSQTAAN